MRVVAYQSIPPNIILDSAGGYIVSSAIDEVLEFLSEPYEHGDAHGEGIKVAWCLDTTIAPMLRLLPIPLALELAKTERTVVVTPAQGGGSKVFKLWYKPGHSFVITDMSTHYEAGIFDLGSFFPPNTEPPDSEHYLVETEVMCRLLLRTYLKMGFSPKTLYSPISILKPVLKQQNIPTFQDIPDGMHEAARDCMKKPWREALQVGYWNKVWDMDLGNAYANILSTLLDIRKGRFVESNQYEPLATYGYCKCRVTINPKVRFHPVTLYRDVGPNVQPTGTYTEALSKHKIDLIKKWKLGSVEILSGQWWFADTDYKPLLKLIEMLKRIRYSRKEADKWDYEHAVGGLAKDFPLLPLMEKLQRTRMSDLIAHNAKGMLVGIFGYTGRETDTKLSEFYNPVYSAEAYEQTACKVADFCYSKGVVPIHISVDGFLSPDPIPLTADDIKAGWKLNYEGEALVMSSTESYFKDRRPNGLSIHEAKALIQEHPERAFWETKVPRILSLGNAASWNEMDKLGTRIDHSAHFDLLGEHDRFFATFPDSGKKLMSKKYSSRPYKVTELKGVPENELLVATA